MNIDYDYIRSADLIVCRRYIIHLYIYRTNKFNILYYLSNKLTEIDEYK